MAPKLSFLAPRFEVGKVSGKDLKFFAVSTRTLFKIKSFAGPLAQALVTIMAGKSQDVKRLSRDFHDTTTGDLGQETVIEPLTINMAKLRDGQRSGAIEQLLETVANDDNRYILGELICDSLREEFHERPIQHNTVQEFMDDEDMSLPVLVELLTGVFKANKGAFGPLAGPLAAKIKAAVSAKMQEVPEETPEAESESGETPE